MHHIDVHVEKDIYDVNNRIADANAGLLKKHGIRAFDLLGAIGSGKTATIERLVPLLRERGLRVGAIAGDVYGDDDFQRIVALGVSAYNANTGKECHLDAHQHRVHERHHRLQRGDQFPHDRIRQIPD